MAMCATKRIFVYKLDSFVGFNGDEQFHAQECYVTARETETRKGTGQDFFVLFFKKSLFYYYYLFIVI
jgi:hypothetical protein